MNVFSKLFGAHDDSGSPPARSSTEAAESVTGATSSASPASEADISSSDLRADTPATGVPDQDSPQGSSAAVPDADVSDAPGSTSTEALRDLDQRVVDVIKTCYDPEIPINIYELGLIYQIRVKAHGAVHVSMTLTSPNCPAAQSLPSEVREKVRALPGVTDAEVEVVWDPPWSPARMSEAAKLELGFF